MLFSDLVLIPGIPGADYPLSAVICSEFVFPQVSRTPLIVDRRFAPTPLRGKMLTLVFMCQPLGQLAATLIALIAAVRQRDGIPSDATVTQCTGECLKTLDSIWRWIIGVGVIPAVIAIWFRLTIIESPRYTADVGRDSRKAASELNRYLPSEAVSTVGSSTSVNDIAEDHNQETNGHLGDSENGNTEENKPPPEPSWKDFKKYFWHDGNLRTLLATSFCWFCIDLPCKLATAQIQTSLLKSTG